MAKIVSIRDRNGSVLYQCCCVCGAVEESVFSNTNLEATWLLFRIALTHKGWEYRKGVAPVEMICPACVQASKPKPAAPSGPAPRRKFGGFR